MLLFGALAQLRGICFRAVLELAVPAAGIAAPDDDGPKYGRTKSVCVCAKSLEDVWPVFNAYNHKDAEALRGLVARGQALPLDEGVKVKNLGEDDGVVDVSIESGFHADEMCHLPYSFVEWDADAQ